MKQILMIATILLLFSGCSQKEPAVIIEKEIICVEQSIYPFGTPIQIRNHPDDTELIKTRSEYLKKGFEHYEQQVIRNNELCKDKNK